LQTTMAAVHLMETARTFAEEKPTDNLCVRLTKKKMLCVVTLFCVALVTADIAVTTSDLLKKTSVDTDLVVVTNATVNMTAELKNLFERFMGDYYPPGDIDDFESPVDEHKSQDPKQPTPDPGNIAEWNLTKPGHFHALALNARKSHSP